MLYESISISLIAFAIGIIISFSVAALIKGIYISIKLIEGRKNLKHTAWKNSALASSKPL